MGERDERRWLTAEEVGARFNCPANTVREGKAGFDELPRVQFGRNVRYHREDVELFEQRRRRAAASLRDVREAVVSSLLSHVLPQPTPRQAPAARRHRRKANK